LKKQRKSFWRRTREKVKNFRKRVREKIQNFAENLSLKDSAKVKRFYTISKCKTYIKVYKFIKKGQKWLCALIQGKQLIVISIVMLQVLTNDLNDQQNYNGPVRYNPITIERSSVSQQNSLAKFSPEEHEALFPQQESYKIIKNVDWRANGLTPKPQYGHPRPNRSGVPGVNPPPGTPIGTPFSSITKGSAGSNSGQFGTGKVTNEPIGVSRSATNLSAKKTGSSSQSNSKELEQFDQPRAANDPAIIDVKHSFEENKSLKKVT
jgi:hypothetical protein